MSVEVRFAEPRDVPAIARLIRSLAQFEKLEHVVVMTEELLGLALFGPRPYAETLIAEDGGVAVGFALFFHTFSTFLARPGIYLEDLYVVEEARGRGVGRRLLARLAQTAVERGCARLEWAVLNWNTDAIAFYERLGASPNSAWTTYRLAGEPLHRLARQ
ncbi:MAG TPA: GNAT family N-acetyltransferase [Patescibacteria group bacterium]|nr:GNAT family N-acetyltransferase [Patescibacteria group bacterium]